MYKVGDFVTAKKTIYDSDVLILKKDNIYKIIDIQQPLGDILYFFIDELNTRRGALNILFYNKQEIREIKLNKLLNV